MSSGPTIGTGGDAGRGKAKHLMLDVRVPSEDLSYQIRVGEGLLDALGREVQRAQDGVRKVALVTDETVVALYGSRARASLEAEGLEVSEYVIPAGEASKTTAVLVPMVSAMVDAGLSRRDLVVTLGGGVVGDLGGLAAALFMRGIGCLQCPTSLLAQVDASVGGKVAVDLPEGKNLLGAFHFPRAVVIDTALLSTLPERELSSGLAEMLKHGLLFDRAHYEQLLESSEDIYAHRARVIARLVAHSVALKAACVSRDPMEMSSSGKGRVLLNLGHTLGHAVEHVSQYAMTHGAAVAIGLRAAARISEARGLAPAGFETTITEALQRLRLPHDLDQWLQGERGDAVEAALMRDKKRAGQRVTFIGLAGIADPTTLALGPDEIMALLRGQSAR